MFRKSLKSCMPFLFLLLTAAYIPAAPALAASIDFTNSLFSDCDNQTSCEKTVGGVLIRIEGWKDADPKDGVLDPLVDTPAPLYWKLTDDNGYHDGFGVKTGELDEIERPEFLVVRFLNAADPGGPGNWHYVKHQMSQINITNLFNENGYLERGAYKFTLNEVDGSWIAFLADTSQVLGSTNGVLNLPVPTPPHSDELADFITFTAPEPGYTIPSGENFEFSLAGLNAEALYTLSVSRFGTGSGTVTGSPSGINCGLICTKDYDNGTMVTLTATPDAGSIFSGWTGDCDASGHVTVNADKSCTATFTLNTYSLTINTAGTGSGTTTGAGTYNSGQTATVSASANAGSTFSGWTGPNAAECATGSVLMNGNKSCIANFTLNTYTLTLTTSGSGSGTVSGAGTYNYGQTATDSASANAGSTFSGWTGPDAAECATGSVLMNANKSCTANFTLNTYTLTLTTSGSGSGTVSGAGTYNYGQTVSVSASANTGSTFTGWTGPDAAECTTGSVLMNANKSCTANFTLNTYTLTLTTSGSGSGTVSGAGTYNYGQTATASASANAGSTFSGWTGPNAAECATGSVLMNANKSCTANFTLNTYTLTLTTAGSGSGTVSGAGTYNYGQTATVSASANAGSTFSGWTGANAAECATGSVLMNANKSCTANFTLNTYTLTLTTSGSGSGTVSGAGTYNYGQTATVSASANAGSTFSGWTGPDAAECTTGSVLMNTNKSCTANFTLNTFTLTLTTAGSGSGTVSGAGTYNYGQTATVSATANTGSIFTGWTGANAAECATGSVLMNANKSCTANFNLPAPPTDIIADLVLCQVNFTSNTVNAGQPSTNGIGCNLPYAVAVDRSVTPNRVYVSDYNNNRVLGWSNESNLANGAPADLVIGQPGFTTNTCNNGTLGAGTLCVPMGMAVDSAGNLYVADRANSRILVFNSPFTTDTIADMVIGQTDFVSGGCSNPNIQFASASSLCVPTGVTLDNAGNMYVADMANNRVLEYNAPLSTGMAASRVIGQANFTSKAASTGAASLNQPYAVAVDGAGNLYVADFNNNRVLEYNAPLSTGMSANRVFGQTNMTNNVANLGGISANSLWNPWGVAVDTAGNLYVADHSNHRMLEYDTPLTTNTTADRVFGQPGFTTSNCNRGGLGAGSLCIPSGPALDSLGDVWVADFGNNRVLEYGH